MSDKSLAKQLKTLQHERAGGSPDARWVASTRETILMQISNTVGGAPRKTGFAAFAQTLGFFSGEIGRMAVVPMVAVALLVGAHFAAAAVVAVSAKTVPGDVLYGTKLAAEQVSLLFASPETRAQLELGIAGRRLDEMVRLADGTDAQKEAKLSSVSANFADAMSHLRADLVSLRSKGANDASIRLAMQVDQQADAYQKVFAQSELSGRPNIRLALLSLDQVSVQALEVLVDQKHADGSNVLPDAEISSSVGQQIDTFAAHVAAASDIPSAARAEVVVAEAKVLFTNGDFTAAVRKVIEGAAIATQTQATASATTAPVVESTTGTKATSATGTRQTPY